MDGECSVDTDDCSYASLTMAFSPVLDAFEIEVFPFEATGEVSQISITSNWTQNGASWPGDMGFALISPQGAVMGTDGFNITMSSVGYPLYEIQLWPSDWNDDSSGVYFAQLTPELPLSGDGTWQLVILNGYSSSNTIYYDLIFELQGLCGQ